MTHIEQQRVKFVKVQNQICKILRISDETYSIILFESAFAFLESQYEILNNEQIKIVSQSILFWNWWKNQYYLIDEKLLNDMENDPTIYYTSLIEFERLYRSFHSPSEISIDKAIIRKILVQHEYAFTQS